MNFFDRHAVDPGFGFGWSVPQNLEMLRRLGRTDEARGAYRQALELVHAAPLTSAIFASSDVLPPPCTPETWTP